MNFSFVFWIPAFAGMTVILFISSVVSCRRHPFGVAINIYNFTNCACITSLDRAAIDAIVASDGCASSFNVQHAV